MRELCAILEACIIGHGERGLWEQWESMSIYIVLVCAAAYYMQARIGAYWPTSQAFPVVPVSLVLATEVPIP